MIRWALLYGIGIAGGGLALQALGYLGLVRAVSGPVHLALVAGLFLALGLALGIAAMRAPPLPPGNPQARDALGISARELEILTELAAGHSNKEIARRLEISPNTVKTHVARLFAKLDAQRRTEAISRARSLGLLP